MVAIMNGISAQLKKRRQSQIAHRVANGLTNRSILRNRLQHNAPQQQRQNRQNLSVWWNY